MSHCGHEHHHGHDGHTHDDDDHLKAEGELNSLFSVIDKDGVQALNEHEPVSCPCALPHTVPW